MGNCSTVKQSSTAFFIYATPISEVYMLQLGSCSTEYKNIKIEFSVIESKPLLYS